MNNAKSFKTIMLLSALLFAASCGGAQSENSNAPVGEAISAPKLVEQADELYRQREDLAKVRDGLQLLRRARVADGNNYEAAWKLAKFNYFLGNNSPDEALRDKAFKDGATAGKVAARIQPDKPDGYFWGGANLGGQAKANILDGAANLPEIRRNMEKVIALEPNYEGGTAYVALAQIELETRGMMGGSAEKAADYLEQALKSNKQNSFIYLHLAEAYFYLNRKAESKKMLELLRNIPPNPDYLPERREAEEKAKKLAAKF